MKWESDIKIKWKETETYIIEYRLEPTLKQHPITLRRPIIYIQFPKY